MQPHNPFLKHAGIELPLICGPMYPCSNPELIAAVSNNGGIGIVQPISLTHIYGYDFREGLRFIKSLTSKPIGLNALIEKSSSRYLKKMEAWIDIALDEGVRFFITSLGNPDWVVQKVHAYGGIVYHDVTSSKWAKVALKAKVDGLIAVNSWAGGHSGDKDAQTLLAELKNFGLPIICAGGIADQSSYQKALHLGYDGVQMGTRFIATLECSAPLAYKQALVAAKKEDIVMTKNLTGITLSVIQNHPMKQTIPLFDSLIPWFQKKRIFKPFIRIYFALKALKHGQETMKSTPKSSNLWVAGKSVEGIHAIVSVAKIFDAFKASADPK